MTVWKLLYENRFPPPAQPPFTHHDFYRAAEGVQSVQDGPIFSTALGFPGFPIGDGRNITFRPAETLDDVIGIDVTIELVFMGLIVGGSVTLFSTAAGGPVATLTATDSTPSGGETTCRLTIEIDNATATVDSLIFRSRREVMGIERRPLQIRWSSHGQLHIWLDGQLIGYENAIKPGYRFTLNRVSLGDIDRPMRAIAHASVSRFRVVELREESAVNELGQQLDPENLPEVPEACQKVAGAELERLMRDARNLMAGFNQSQTSPWRQGDSGDPFSPTAKTVHETGRKAGRAFHDYLRDGGDKSRGAVAAHLKELPTALAEDQPDLFKQLLAKRKQAKKNVARHCAYAAGEVRTVNPDLMKKLEALNEDFETLVESLGG